MFRTRTCFRHNDLLYIVVFSHFWVLSVHDNFAVENCGVFWHSPNSYHLSLKVTAVKVALSSGSHNQESAINKPLKDQAFATPEKIAELVQKVYTYATFTTLLVAVAVIC